MKFALVAGVLFLTSAWAQQPLKQFEANAQTRLGWPLDTENIRVTVQNVPAMRELDLAHARIIPPHDFTTLTPNPQMEVRHIEQERGALFITLRCQERKDCGSFLAEFVLPNSAASQPVGKDLKALHASSDSLPTLSAAAVATPRPPLVYPRTLAQLVIQEGGLRITELVLPAKRARLGEVVRVSDPHSHRSLLAEVTGPGLLRPVDEIRQGRQDGAR